MRDPRHGRHPGLFIERFEDGVRRSLHKGAWRETEIHEETIRVRSQDPPERVTIHRTCHGPVICGDPAGAAPSRWPRRSSPGASTASTACHVCCAPERRPSSTRRRAAGR
ncbi:penicillin acylase family protein [Salipiger thiooxidans]|nr:penicillin acylase family protein [Salipiger thiooxidans]